MTGQTQNRILPAKIEFYRQFYRQYDHNTTTANSFEYSSKFLERLVQLFVFISHFFREMKIAAWLVQILPYHHSVHNDEGA